MSKIRTRWSAIGASLAVFLGAGGLLTASAAEPAGSVFVPITPTRVLDTRIAIGLPSALVNETPALLDVTGTIAIVNPDQTVGSAVVVPDGATSIVANVTGVSPTTIGYLAVRPGDATGSPSTSSINFTAPGVIIPNSVTVAIPTTGANTGHVNLFYFGLTPTASVHVLVDIVGYYTTGPAGTGPAGPQGPTGPSGPQGPQGPAGQPNSGHSLLSVDTTGDVGYATSITIGSNGSNGSNGNPIISYLDNTNDDLKVIACTNPTCTGPQSPTLLDTARSVGDFTSIVIGTNGNPIISYYDISDADLEVLACGNPTCTNYAGRSR